MGEHAKARSYCEKALEIQQKSLPKNHLDFAQSYNNIGLVYESIKEYSKALSYFERALDIYQGSLPSTHPDIKSVRQNMERVQNKLKV